MTDLHSAPANQAFQYSGTDNLEVMLEATQYNAFLTRLVIANAGRGAPVLDFGAGIGTFSQMVRDAGLEPFCFEPDATQAKILRDKGFTVIPVLDAAADGLFGYIYSLNVFEHIEDDGAAMRIVFQALKPGGRLMLYVPAFPILFGEMDRKVGHFRRYRKEQAEALVSEAGFVVDHASYVDSIGFFATLLFNRFSRSDGSISRPALIVYDRLVLPISLALDRLTRNFFGKNLLVIATKAAD